jgi:hypothetical protein
MTRAEANELDRQLLAGIQESQDAAHIQLFGIPCAAEWIGTDCRCHDCLMRVVDAVEALGLEERS